MLVVRRGVPRVLLMKHQDYVESLWAPKQGDPLDYDLRDRSRDPRLPMHEGWADAKGSGFTYNYDIEKFAWYKAQSHKTFKFNKEYATVVLIFGGLLVMFFRELYREEHHERDANHLAMLAMAHESCEIPAIKPCTGDMPIRFWFKDHIYYPAGHPGMFTWVQDWQCPVYVNFLGDGKTPVADDYVPSTHPAPLWDPLPPPMERVDLKDVVQSPHRYDFIHIHEGKPIESKDWIDRIKAKMDEDFIRTGNLDALERKFTANDVITI